MEFASHVNRLDISDRNSVDSLTDHALHYRFVNIETDIVLEFRNIGIVVSGNTYNIEYYRTGLYCYIITFRCYLNDSCGHLSYHLAEYLCIYYDLAVLKRFCRRDHAFDTHFKIIACNCDNSVFKADQNSFKSRDR